MAAALEATARAHDLRIESAVAWVHAQPLDQLTLPAFEQFAAASSQNQKGTIQK